MRKFSLLSLVLVMLLLSACTGSVPDYQELSRKEHTSYPPGGKPIQALQVAVSTSNLGEAKAIANDIVKKSDGAYDLITVGFYSAGASPGAPAEQVFMWSKGEGLRKIH